jgi:hypothetical protein
MVLAGDWSYAAGAWATITACNTLWRARIAALLGDEDRATDLVRDAYTRGRTDWIALHLDPDLASLRGNRRFRSVLRARD